MRRDLALRIAGALAFQAAWLACVLGAARGLPWLGPVVVLGLAALFVFLTPPRGRALALLAAAALLGFFVDGALVALRALTFTEPAGGPALAAPWMIALWVAFATTLPWSMSFLRGRAALAALLGASLGPLAYAAGARLGAVKLGVSLPESLGLVALAWGLALPVLAAVSEGLLGRRPAETAQPGMK